MEESVQWLSHVPHVATPWTANLVPSNRWMGKGEVCVFNEILLSYKFFFFPFETTWRLLCLEEDFLFYSPHLTHQQILLSLPFKYHPESNHISPHCWHRLTQFTVQTPNIFHLLAGVTASVFLPGRLATRGILLKCQILFFSFSIPSQENSLAILEPESGMYPETVVIPWRRKGGRGEIQGGSALGKWVSRSLGHQLLWGPSEQHLPLADLQRQDVEPEHRLRGWSESGASSHS